MLVLVLHTAVKPSIVSRDGGGGGGGKGGG